MIADEKNPIVIRDITPGDHDVIMELNRSAVPAVSIATDEHMDWLISIACYPKVAAIGEEVVGFLLGLPAGSNYSSENYRWFAARYEEFVYVDRVVVAEERRGSGVGRAFYEDIVEFSLSRAPVLLCEVNVKPRNDGSLRFHERFGFAEVGQLDTEGGSKRVSLLARPILR